MHRAIAIAIYDLDKTLTRRATYTPFLIYTAWRIAPWRLVFLPLWIILMLGHKAGLYGRAPLKQAGFALLVGSPANPRLADTVEAFAARAAARLYPGARRQWDEDGEAGAMRVIATAALELYAAAIARHLNADMLIATPMDGNGRLAEGNNYADGKAQRVMAWFVSLGIDRAEAEISFYSDHASDAPLLDWADHGYLVTSTETGRAKAAQRGWTAIDFTR